MKRFVGNEAMSAAMVTVKSSAESLQMNTRFSVPSGTRAFTQLEASAHVPSAALFQARTFALETVISPSPSIQPTAFGPEPE